MKISIKIASIILTLTGILITTGCEETTGEQSESDKEKRYFDLYASSRYPDVEPLTSGLYFLENSAGEGVAPDTGNWVMINHVCYMIPEDLIYESYVENVAEDNHLDDNKTALYGPYKLKVNSRNEGLTEGLTLMHEGGGATMLFTSDLGYGEKGNGKIAGYKSLKYEVELLEVIPDIEAYEQAKLDAYLDTISESDTIQYPAFDAVMYYIIDETTDGAPVGIDSTITVAYKGYLTDGRVFDEKTAEDPYSYTVTSGEAQFIIGWELGMLRLKEGEKARFVIPYQLAYGAVEQKNSQSGLRTIPPYETLLFDIEIISVTPATDDGNDPGVEEPQ